MTETLPSPNTLTNAFNSYYSARDDDSVQFKNYSDKVAERTSRVEIIDISKYNGLIEMNSGGEVYDMRLRGILAVPDEAKLREYILPQLRFTPVSATTDAGYISMLRDYFKQDDNLRMKLFNSMFPHGIHNPDKPARGVNVVYLQRVCKYHDIVLESLMRPGDVDDKTIYEAVQKQYAFDIKPEYSSEISVMVCNPQIITEFMSDNDVNIWVTTLKKPKTTGTNVKWTGAVVDKTDIACVRTLVRELLSAKAFIANIRCGMAAHPEINIRDVYTNYKRVWSDVGAYYNQAPGTHFITYFINSARFIRDTMKFAEPVKLLMSFLKVRFNKATRARIEELAATDAPITDVDSLAISAPRINEFNDLDVYNRIGKYATPTTLTKHQRTCVGLAIVAYVNEQLAIIRARSRSTKLTVYFKA